jgi:hypothetical protein
MSWASVVTIAQAPRITKQVSGKSVAPSHRAGDTAGMSEQEDYDDQPDKKRQPPSLLLLALIIIAVLFVLALGYGALVLVSFVVNFPAQD